MADPIIKTENASVVYGLGKSSEFTALSGININIYPGEYAVIFGPSGCGKSTLLYCLAGLENITGGKIFINGISLHDANKKTMVGLRRTQMGMIFQAYNLIPTVNVLDNVLMPAISAGSLTSETQKKAESLLNRFGIADFARRYPKDLSGGQQQRVAICRALISWPPILFADEPTGNLDSASTEIVMSYLSELNEKDGKTVVLVTHDPSQLVRAHRIFHMKNGQIIRVTANSEKAQIAPLEESSKTSGAGILSQNHTDIDSMRIKAKALAQYLLTSLDEPAVQRFEDFIRERICGQIDEARFLEMIDKPFDEGGVGLYKQTALALSQKVEKILAEASFIRQEIESPRESMAEIDFKTVSLRQYLLDGAAVHLKKEEELRRLDGFIRSRLDGAIDRPTFQKNLDLPFNQGGVGLNSKTAKNFAVKLEAALAIK